MFVIINTNFAVSTKNVILFYISQRDLNFFYYIKMTYFLYVSNNEYK